MGGVPSKPDPRRRIEVIGAGYSRTGTVSVQLALEKILQGPVIHGGTHIMSREDAWGRKWCEAYEAKRVGDRERLFKLLGELTAGYVATTDLPSNDFLSELLEIYPDAKVVLVTRDPVKWWKSMEPIMKNTSLWWLPYVIFPVPGWRWFPKLISEFSQSANLIVGDVTGPAIIEIYNKRVIELVPKERLLMMDIKEGWEPLSKFLGKPMPDGPFPRANDSEAIEKLAKHVIGKLSFMWMGVLVPTCVGLYRVFHRSR